MDRNIAVIQIVFNRRTGMLNVSSPANKLEAYGMLEMAKEVVAGRHAPKNGLVLPRDPGAPTGAQPEPETELAAPAQTPETAKEAQPQ